MPIASRKTKMARKVKAPQAVKAKSAGAFKFRFKEGTLSPRLRHALAELMRAGLVGPRTTRVSARVSPGLIKAAKKRSGIANDSDLVTAALAMVAASDEFGPWLVQQAGRLPDDFELAL
jgi:hypothetical protein